MKITLNEAVALLKNQESPIAIPTDTMYGLAATLDDIQGIEKIYTIKKRPRSKPLCILISDISDAFDLILSFPEKALLLAKSFWPGPLTLILPANTARIPSLVRNALPSVGIRIPDCEITRNLIREVGPLTVPSANLSGHPPALSLEEIQQIFGEEFPILPSEVKPTGIPSTILSFEKNQIQLLREGGLPRKTIALFA